MAGAFINARLDDKKVNALMQRIAKRACTLDPAWRIIGEIGVLSVRENFMAGGRPNSWQPLSPATLFGVVRGRKGYTKRGDLRKPARRRLASKRILVGRGMRGGLMGTIHYSLLSPGVAIGTNKEYAAIHHFGGQAGRGLQVTIPARPYLMLQDSDAARIADVMSDWLLD